MKKRRHNAVIIISLTLLMLLCPALALAADMDKYQPYAEALAPLGVFVGTDSGFELEREPTRAEGMVMLIRLLGVEKEAQALADAPIPFTDVPGWAHGYVAYAYENGLTQGTGPTTFSAGAPMDAKMFCTFLLRSLGYSDGEGGQFTFTSSLAYARQLGLIQTKQINEILDGEFTRGHVAKLAYDALNFPCKDGETTLLQKLVDEGKISPALAGKFLATVIPEEDSPTPVAPAEDTPATPQQEPAAATIKTMSQLAEYTNAMVRVESDSNGYICSGIFIDGEGTFITSYPLLKDATYIQLGLPDKTTYFGDIYVQDYDAELGIFVMKANYKPKVYATLGDSSQLKIGDTVVSIGSAVANYNNMGSGKITEITDYNIHSETLFQAGNGLFNMYGQLVGIQLSVRSSGDYSTALPINMLSRVSEKKLLTLKEFNKLAAGVKPPARVRLVEELGNTVFLSWDNVPGADYYCLYLNNTNASDSFYFYSDGENLIRPYKIYAETNSEYGFMEQLTDIKPNTPVNIRVTAVKDGIESEYSKVLSFRKHPSVNTANMEKPADHYALAPWAPDFGALYGYDSVIPATAESGLTFYFYQQVSLDEVKDYVKLLEENNFTYNKFLSNYFDRDENYEYSAIYTNKETNRHIILVFTSANYFTIWMER